MLPSLKRKQKPTFCFFFQLSVTLPDVFYWDNPVVRKIAHFHPGTIEQIFQIVVLLFQIFLSHLQSLKLFFYEFSKPNNSHGQKPHSVTPKEDTAHHLLLQPQQTHLQFFLATPGALLPYGSCSSPHPSHVASRHG